MGTTVTTGFVINSIKIKFWCRAIGPGNPIYCNIGLITDGTEYIASGYYAQSSGYRWIEQRWYLNPKTGLAWTFSDVNSLTAIWYIGDSGTRTNFNVDSDQALLEVDYCDTGISKATLNAVSGTGSGNTFTPTLANVGLDQQTIDGNVSYFVGDYDTHYLRVHVDSSTDLGTISYIKVKAYAKNSTSEEYLLFTLYDGTLGGICYMSNDYSWHEYEFLTNPSGNPWTWTDINSLNVGINCSLDFWTTTFSCDQIIVEVFYTPSAGPDITGTGALTLFTPTLSASGFLAHIGTGTLDLQLIQINGTGIVAHIGTGALSLLSIQLNATGIVAHVGSAALSLSLVQVQANGFLIRFVTASLSLSSVQVSASGFLIRFATANLTLPLVQCNATAVKVITATGALSLPLIQVNGNAVFYNAGSSSLTLPSIQVNGNAVFYNAGSSSLTLPSIQVSGTGIVCHIHGTANLVLQPVSVNATGHFDITDKLDEYIKTWFFSKRVIVWQSGDMPVFQAWPEAVVNDDWTYLPKGKYAELIIQIRVRDWSENSEQLKNRMFQIDELIKQKMERDIQLISIGPNPTGNATITYLGPSKFIQISNYIGELQLSLRIRTVKFVAGERASIV
jgi:hypothetical protein